jgi:hypothetical protein
MESAEHDDPTAAGDTGADADAETPEEFADDIESDPAYNPPIEELKDLKGG